MSFTSKFLEDRGPVHFLPVLSYLSHREQSQLFLKGRYNLHLECK